MMKYRIGFVLLTVLMGILLASPSVNAQTPPPATPVPATPVPATPVPATFKQSPNIDLRPVTVEISKSTDGQFELVLGNPAINGDVNMVGEVVLTIPPGMTIYSSILAGSGGTGMVQSPFVNDPIRPGSTRVNTIFVRSQVEGMMEITAVITVWPEGNIKASAMTKRAYLVEVKEKSGTRPAPGTVGETSQSQEPSGGCSLGAGGRPDVGMALMILMIPALGLVRRRRRNRDISER
jgi:hypothetical protein